MDMIFKNIFSKHIMTFIMDTVLNVLVIILNTSSKQHASAHPRTHAPTHPRTHAPTHPRTHAPTHPRTHAPTHPRTHPRTHVPTHPRTHARHTTTPFSVKLNTYLADCVQLQPVFVAFCEIFCCFTELTTNGNN